MKYGSGMSSAHAKRRAQPPGNAKNSPYLTLVSGRGSFMFVRVMGLVPTGRAVAATR